MLKTRSSPWLGSAYSIRRGGWRDGEAGLAAPEAALPAGAVAEGEPAETAPAGDAPAGAGVSDVSASNIDEKTRYAMTKTATTPATIAMICFLFSASRRCRTFRASMTSRREGIALEVSAESAIVSVADGERLGIEVELFEPGLRRDFFGFAFACGFVGATATSPEEFDL